MLRRHEGVVAEEESTRLGILHPGVHIEIRYYKSGACSCNVFLYRGSKPVTGAGNGAQPREAFTQAVAEFSRNAGAEGCRMM